MISKCPYFFLPPSLFLPPLSCLPCCPLSFPPLPCCLCAVCWCWSCFNDGCLCCRNRSQRNLGATLSAVGAPEVIVADPGVPFHFLVVSFDDTHFPIRQDLVLPRHHRFRLLLQQLPVRRRVYVLPWIVLTYPWRHRLLFALLLSVQEKNSEGYFLFLHPSLLHAGQSMPHLLLS